MGKIKCACKHVGRCPVNDYVSPLMRTYPDGTKVFRTLSKAEQAAACLQEVIDGKITMHRKPELGEQVATDGKGTMHVVAKAIDPARAVAYAQAFVKKGACKAHKRFWRKRNPVPEADTLYSKAQIPIEIA